MTYFKIYDAQGEIVDAEAIEDPVYVCWQEKNRMLLRCKEREAYGLVSGKNSDNIFHLNGKHLEGVETDLSAFTVTEAEYDEYIATRGEEPDPEDDSPEIPDDQPDMEVLTRAELTALVREQAETLQVQAETINMLQECLLEMSEVVYE